MTSALRPLIEQALTGAQPDHAAELPHSFRHFQKDGIAVEHQRTVDFIDVFTSDDGIDGRACCEDHLGPLGGQTARFANEALPHLAGAGEGGLHLVEVDSEIPERDLSVQLGGWMLMEAAHCVAAAVPSR